MLTAIGLTASEESVYRALLEHSPASMTELRARPALADSAPTAAQLATLEAKGLIRRIPGRPVRYAAAAPDVAIEAIIRSHEQDLQRARLVATQLTETFRSGQRRLPDDVIEVVTGREAVHQRWQHAVSAARTELCGTDRPPYSGRGSPRNPMVLDKLGQGVAVRAIYDRAGMADDLRLNEIYETADLGEQVRIAAQVPLKMAIADGRMALVPLALDTIDASLVVHPSPMLDGLRALFEALWERATPLGTDRATDAPDLPDVKDRRLLALLAAGLTDKAIGRQLGWHQRTVQRQVRLVMDTLGVHTRFQAGLQIGQRGWL